MFKPGDVVRSQFKNSEKMTVEKKIDDKIFLCTWFDDKNKLHRAAFHLDVLQLVPKEAI